MHEGRLAAAAAAAMVCAAVAASPAQAARLIAYTYTNGAGGYVDDYKDQYGDVGPLTAHVGNVAQSTADYGVLKISTDHTVSGAGPTEHASANASFEDTVSILSGAVGTAGVATFSLNVDGSLSSSSTGGGAYDSSLSITLVMSGSGINARYNTVYPLVIYFNDSSGSDFGFVKTHGSFDSNGSLVYDTQSLGSSNGAFGTFTFDVPFFSGRDFTLGISAACSSDQYGWRSSGSSTTTDCALGHTITWGGLQRVTTAGGDRTTATVTAESGTNYAANLGGGVPEPSTWALVILGFGASGAMLRRRRLTAA